MDFVGEALGVPSFAVYALLAVIVVTMVVVGAFLLRTLRDTPLRFCEPQYPKDVFVTSLPSVAHRKCGAEKDTNDPRSNATGMFGELLTALIMVNCGWRQLPSQPDGGGTGIDAIFVRQTSDGSGWRVCITETKASREGDGLEKYERDRQEHGRYALDEFEINKNLGKLLEPKPGGPPYLAPEIIEATLKGLKRRSRFVTTNLFVHSFKNCETRVYPVGRDGSYDQSRYREISERRYRGYRNLLVALEIGIARLVRKVGEDNPAKVIIDRNKVAMQDEAMSRHH